MTVAFEFENAARRHNTQRGATIDWPRRQPVQSAAAGSARPAHVARLARSAMRSFVA